MARSLETRPLDAWLRQVRHDLKAPLLTIRGYVDLMQRGAAGPLTPRMERYLARVMEATLRECALIDSQVTLSRSRSGSPSPPLPTRAASPLCASDDRDSPPPAGPLP
jgi:two-component system, OmpR family, sensor kinase